MIGTVLRSRYELTGLVQDGPIFSTYSAKDRQQSGEVAIRVLKAPFNRDAQFIDCLRDTVAKYRSHQGVNVESIQRLEQEDAHVFLVGDLTRGPSLADRIRKLAPFSIQVSVGTAISLCHALEALHRNGVAHGDLTSQNIAVLADGDVRLQLTGVWEAYSASSTAATMVLPGMAPYLAPEVSSGAMPSPRSDVYSTGILLYELLTGRSPYYAETPMGLALQHRDTPTPSVRDINPSVPTVLNEIVKTAMAKDPAERYATAAELLADLRLLQDALRFGKQLTWPLRPTRSATANVASVPTVPKKPSKKEDRVAPRMSAIRDEDEYEEKRKKRDKDRDVPVWLIMLTVFLGAVVVTLVGVWMVINLNKPRTVPVPNVTNMTIAEARAVLKDSKLEMRILRRTPDPRIEMDRIINVNPPAGEQVKEGGEVSVEVSAGTPTVAVPDLSGLTLDKAKAVLNSLNLELDETVERVASTSVTEGLVVRTNPPAKQTVDRQSKVRIVLSAGRDVPASTGSSDPGSIATDRPGRTNEEGGYLYTLRVQLTDLTSPTTVRIEMEDDKGIQTIFEQQRMPKDEVSVTALGQGAQATFRFFYDGELVKTVTKKADGQE